MSKEEVKDNDIYTEKVFRDYGCFDNKNNDKIICLNVSRSYLLCERPNLYECTRKYWRLCGQRAQNADFVFAVCSGYIVGVFKPIRWYLTTSEKYKGRWEFEGKEISDSPFINMSISHIAAKRQNPVMYINM
jgi:hypothetical protein